jgi:hypothetical protein
MQYCVKPLLSVTLLASLAACGGGSSNSGNETHGNPPVTSTERGTLTSASVRVSQLDPAGVANQTSTFGEFGAQVLAATGAPKCGIDVHRFAYNTVGAAGEKTTASAALMVPTACPGKHPLLLYGHGSSEFRNISLTDLRPTAPYGATAITIAAMFAAQGYIVVAPNYAGYDSSTLNYHPHHIAEQNGKEMIDALSAARKALASLPQPAEENGKLFLSGYSEGGYVTMATHRAMQEAGITVTASAPQSGNYAESVSYEALFSTPGAFDDLGQVEPEQMLQYAMQFTAWQKQTGKLYSSPTELYSAAYAAGIETAAPTSLAIDKLVSSGVLAPFLLANDMPNYAGLSPAQKAHFGSPDKSLIKTDFLVRVLADAKANPCPVTAAAEPLACKPGHPLRTAWLSNDLRSWTPRAPMLLCGGHGDGEVPFQNTELSLAYFQAHGVGPGLVAKLDVDSDSTAGDPYGAAKAAFRTARATVVRNGGDPASPAPYHGYMAFSACHIAVRDYFSKF